MLDELRKFISPIARLSALRAENAVANGVIERQAELLAIQSSELERLRMKDEYQKMFAGTELKACESENSRLRGKVAALEEALAPSDATKAEYTQLVAIPWDAIQFIMWAIFMRAQRALFLKEAKAEAKEGE